MDVQPHPTAGKCIKSLMTCFLDFRILFISFGMQVYIWINDQKNKYEPKTLSVPYIYIYTYIYRTHRIYIFRCLETECQNRQVGRKREQRDRSLCQASKILQISTRIWFVGCLRCDWRAWSWSCRLRSQIFKVCKLVGNKTLFLVVEQISFLLYLYYEAGKYQFVKKVNMHLYINSVSI